MCIVFVLLRLVTIMIKVELIHDAVIVLVMTTMMAVIMFLNSAVTTDGLMVT